MTLTQRTRRLLVDWVPWRVKVWFYERRHGRWNPSDLHATTAVHNLVSRREAKSLSFMHLYGGRWK